ncbi:MAG TPA: M28 family peptidase [Thermodesulfovibrionales bacterium]|nr:M28 family peptidase [Thermodesulfovibrionales bacterium]
MMENIETNLRATVKYLSEEIGQRSYLDLKKLNSSSDFIEERFRLYGCAVERQPFTYEGNTYYNIIGGVDSRRDMREGTLVIGAHYDTVVGTPGADDNASGVAGLLELARLLSSSPAQGNISFVAFSLEEPPVFLTSRMGSHVYAESLHSREVEVRGMISLEMLGYYCDSEGCQYYPSSLFKLRYPDRGNFIAFVGNRSSRAFTQRLKKAFMAVSSLPVESLNTFSFVPGVDFSDHRSFWKFGYPAFMITDTAFYRNPNYHGPADMPETLDYKKMADLVAGLFKALMQL